MKFLYLTNSLKDPLKVKDICKTYFGNEIIDQTFFPKILEETLGKQENIYLEAYYKASEKINKSIKNGRDISGIIIPIGHGDENCIKNISDEINVFQKLKKEKAPYLDEKIKRIIRTQNSEREFWKDFDHLEEVKEYKNKVREIFNESVRIPIFEAYMHLPGHRNVPLPANLINKPVIESLDYVEGAFRVWINRNFKK